MATTYQVPDEEVQSAIDFLKAALAVGQIYDCQTPYEELQKLRLTNVNAAILQLTHAKRHLETPGKEFILKSK